MTTADVVGIVLLVVWVLAAAWSARTEGCTATTPCWRRSWTIWPLGALGVGYLMP